MDKMVEMGVLTAQTTEVQEAIHTILIIQMGAM